MLFRKNIGRKEQVVRVLTGLLMVLCGLVGLQATPLGWFTAAVGLISLLTGLVRYCPACDMAGKKTCQ